MVHGMNDKRDSESLFGPGKVFAEGREAIDMSREQMADVLNLPVRTILAIEENNPSVLPDAVYVNGYMRSYAKLLGLASQPLIDAWWAQHVENQEQVSIEGHNDEMVEKTVNVRPFKMGRWAVAGLVLSAGFVYFVSNNNQQAANNKLSDVQANVEALEKEPLLEPQSTTETAQEMMREANSEPVKETVKETLKETVTEAGAHESIAETLTSLPRAGDQDALAVSGAEIAEPEVVEGDTDARAVQREIFEPMTDDLSMADLPTDDSVASSEAKPERESPLAFALPRLTEFGDNTIVLSFSADCWFEIRNESGDLLYADLGRDTQTRRYVGDGPFRIKLGFSPGVTLMFNGGVVDLEPHTRRDVANVIVGASVDDAEPAPQTNATQATLLW
jgi:cytoskeleton protein RodZ